MAQATKKYEEATNELDKLDASAKINELNGDFAKALKERLELFDKSRDVKEWEGVRVSFLWEDIDNLWRGYQFEPAKDALRNLMGDFENDIAQGRAQTDLVYDWLRLVQHVKEDNAAAYKKLSSELISRVRTLPASKDRTRILQEFDDYI